MAKRVKRRDKKTEEKKMKKTEKMKFKRYLFIILGLLILAACAFIYHRQEPEGEKWALLVSGSWAYIYYRHEADISHAYQLLRRNGFKDSHIIVFMSNVAAFHGNNPNKGTLINNPKRIDYYRGIPKDYVGQDATAANLIAVLLGDKSKIKGGSGKLLQSGPNDRVFLFYTGHGDEVRFQMPTPRHTGYVLKSDITTALKIRFANSGYKSLIFYVNSCLAGDIGMDLSKELKIYVVTCGARHESCESAYCPRAKNRNPPYSPEEYSVCLASEFGASWMEHCEEVDTTKVTLQEQFEAVKKRVFYSNVTQHGDLSLAKDKLSVYIGASKPINLAGH